MAKKTTAGGASPRAKAPRRPRTIAPSPSSEDKLRSLADISPNMIFIWTPRGVVYANRMCAQMMGYSQEEICSPAFDFRQLIAPASLPQVEGNLRRHLQGEEVSAHEYQLVTRDGRVLDAIHSTKLVEYGGGPAVLGVVTDITDRRRAELALQESEALHRTVLENIDEVVYQVDATPDNLLDARTAFVSGKVGAILGHDPEEFQRDPGLWRSLIHPDDVAAMERQTRLVFSSTQGTTRVYRLRSKAAGDYRWVEDRIVAKVDENGQAVGFYGVLRDVTERRRAEEEIRRLHRAVEQSPVSVIVTDREGRIDYVNACFVEVSGYTKEEVLGQNPRLLKSGAQPTEFYRDLWGTILAGREWRGQLLNRRKDGGQYWSQVVISPVTGDDGEIAHFISLGQDITEFRRQEEALKQSQAQLIQAQKSEAVGRLAGGIAHDFNNLMNVIGGYAEILLRRLPPRDPLRGKVDQISQAAARAAGLTRQLLAYSRRQVLQPVVMNLNSLLAEHAGMLARLIGEDVELVVEPGPELGRVLADPGQMEQVVMNLAVNAREAMPGGGRLLLSTSNEELLSEDPRRRGLAPPGHYVRLAVADTGSGMTEEVRAHLFEPFFTTKGPGKGTGLGLSTVYGIVRQSGGYVWADTAPGRGTTFEIFLPRIAAPPSREQPRDLPAAQPARGDGRCVLLVEDNAPLRALTREVLETAGFRVLEAADGEEATLVARDSAGPIALLLTDVVLPKRGGRELAIEVLALHPEARVLFASGYTADALSVHGVLEAGLAFLPKPASADELLAKVAEVLGDRSDGSSRP